MRGILWLGVLGCVGGTDDGGGGGKGGPGDDPPIETNATIALTAPSDSYGDLALVWQVSGFALGSDGHVHVYVDDTLVAETPGLGFLLTDLGAGSHDVEVRLANTAEAELDASDGVTVRVVRPSITLAPAEDLPEGSYVELPVAVTGLTLQDPPSGTAAFGVGHYALTVDGSAWGWSADPALVAVSRLEAGVHEVRAELVSGDGTPLSTRVQSEPVIVDVPAGSPFLAIDQAPAAGEWRSPAVPISLTVANFILGERPADTGAPPLGISGWYHLYVDGAWGYSSHEPTGMLNHLSGGWHRVDVVLVEALSGWEIPVRDTLRVHVAEDRPSIVIADPGDGYGVRADFTLTVAVENHDAGYLVSIDGAPPVSAAAATTAVTGLTAGPHTVRVALADEAGVELSPVVFDAITVNVSGP